MTLLFFGCLSLFLGVVIFSFSLSISGFLLFIAFLLVFVVVYFYVQFYLQDSCFCFLFNYFYCFFGIIISCLIFSSSFFIFLFFWDLLGVASLFLVLYYFTQSSIVGAISTGLTSRFGDFFLIFSLLSGFLTFFTCGPVFYLISFFFLFIASFTKSASYPFIGWLPRAMAAPTPVSSLVHSSTLVLGGLILLFNFSWVLCYVLGSQVLLVSSLFTLVFSGVIAMLEQDLNKVIALSTCSQVAFCIFSFSCNLPLFGLCQAVSHAFFNSTLFMVVGYFIYIFMGQQDSRIFGSVFFHYYYLLCLWSFYGLFGLFFMCTSVSKEILFFSFVSSSFSFFIFIFFLFGASLTFFYCFRVWSSISLSVNSILSFLIFPSISFFLGISLIISCFLLSVFYSNYCNTPLLFLEVDVFMLYVFYSSVVFFSLFVISCPAFIFSAFILDALLFIFSKFLIWVPPTESFFYNILFDFFLLLQNIRSVLYLGVLSNHGLFLLLYLAFLLMLV